MTYAVPPAPTESLDVGDQTRAELYLLLGNLLASPPNAEVLDLLANSPGGEQPAEGDLQVALQALRGAAKNAIPIQVEEEFFNLFIGLGRGELAPYASWYLTGYLMEQPLAALRTELKRLGYERQEDIAEPEDHAAALCEVMGMIVSESVLSFKEQQAFFETFLKSWLGRFFTDLTLAETADFYKAVGNLGRCFLEIEDRYFSMPV